MKQNKYICDSLLAYFDSYPEMKFRRNSKRLQCEMKHEIKEDVNINKKKMTRVGKRKKHQNVSVTLYKKNNGEGKKEGETLFSFF